MSHKSVHIPTKADRDSDKSIKCKSDYFLYVDTLSFGEQAVFSLIMIGNNFYCDNNEETESKF